ncbi:winged-helix domain-containing protein [Haloimpatiens sp. FM7315]|uniref:winged-helix domain-containing protein n=1 Tax=Haloimpatiens sp. FM7315 TaxID=3298609 RepID=UPI0039772A6B
MIKEGKFREDLYYRLNVLPINIPPLRERREDIIDLIKYFVGRDCTLDEKVKSKIKEYYWPGNIRELQNTASYISLMCSGTVTVENLPFNLNKKVVVEKKDNRSDLQDLMQIIKSKYSIDVVVEILKIIYRFNKSSKNIGRNNIYKLLNENWIIINEGGVRRILCLLNETQLVHSGLGRKGSSISEKGIELLEYLEKD